jgi:hypothetical protein
MTVIPVSNALQILDPTAGATMRKSLAQRARREIEQGIATAVFIRD